MTMFNTSTETNYGSGRFIMLKLNLVAPDFYTAISKLIGTGFASNACCNWYRWNTPYHDINHFIEGAVTIQSMKDKFQNTDWFEWLCIAWLYHDIVYDPLKNDNEELSSDLFNIDWHDKWFRFLSPHNFPSEEPQKQINRLIMLTKDHNAMFAEVKKCIEAGKMDDEYFAILTMLKADLERLTTSDWKRSMDVENMIYREYGIYAWKDYKAGRIAVLKALRNTIVELAQMFNEQSNIDLVIQYLEQKKPKIGLMCGSFNPFQIGHLEMLEYAEKIFDKVIIAIGVNPDKPDSVEINKNNCVAIKALLKTREVITYEGLTTNLVDSITETGCDVTVVRGLRNASDLMFEQTLEDWNTKMSSNYKTAYMLASKDTQHVSSSGIRGVLKSDPGNALALSYIVSEKHVAEIKKKY